MPILQVFSKNVYVMYGHFVVLQLGKHPKTLPKHTFWHSFPQKLLRYVWLILCSSSPVKVVKTPQNITYTNIWTKPVLTQKHPKNTLISPTSPKTFCGTAPVILRTWPPQLCVHAFDIKLCMTSDTSIRCNYTKWCQNVQLYTRHQNAHICSTPKKV